MAEPAALDPRPGVLLGAGRYQLDQLIGSGGMATVWRATDRRLGRTVAVKLISEALVDDPTYAERFAREARTAAGLSHANLVQVYDYGADEDQPFLVMEYVDGGTLAERLERGPVVAEEAAAVAGDLLAALACIHSAGILHRDIKPANVLLSSDGRARITDFGIAHPEDSTRLTQTGHLVGTLRYLAPEVIDGAPASRQSDLYALGVLLRDLAGGEADPTTAELVTRLTEREPARRPQTAEQAQRLLAAPGIPAARPDGPGVPAPAPAPGPVRTPRPSAAPRATARVVTPRRPRLPSIPPGAPPAARPRRAAPTPAPARRRRTGPRAWIVGACLAGLAAIVLATQLGGGTAAPAKPATTHRPATAPTSTNSAVQPSLTNRLDELQRLVRAAGQP